MKKLGTDTSTIIINGQTIDSLFKTMQALVYSDPDSTRMMALDVLAKTIELNQIEWQIRILNLLGATFVIQSHHLQAFEYYHKALKLSIQSNNPVRIGDTYNNLGVLNLTIKNNKDALENFLAAIQNYEMVSLNDKINIIHCNLGLLYLALNNVEKAFYHFHTSQNGFLNMKDSLGLAIVYSHTGASFLKVAQVDSAFHYTDKAIDVATRISDLYTLSYANTIKADIFLSAGSFNEAVKYYNISLNTAIKINNRNIITMAQIGLAKTYLGKKEFVQAHVFADKALEMIDKTNNSELEYKVYEVFSEIFEQTRDFKKSLIYFKTANSIKSEINDQSKLHQLYYMEISQLIKDKEIQQLEIERQKLTLSRRNSLILLLGLLSITIIVIIVLIYYNHINKIRQAQRIKLNETILRHAEEQSKAAFDAEIQERKRLGLELHDGVGPMLSLAKLNLSALLERPTLTVERKSTILQNTVITLNEILREMKNISHNMAPIVLIEKGLKSAVKDLVIKLNETEKYIVSLDISGLNGKMDQYLEHALYRGILEVINNILTHAHGSEINIQIVQNHEDITIMIEDNGIGFDPKVNGENNGLGLKSMISRIGGIKGKVFIDSVLGRGTIITIVVPVSKSNELWKG